MKAEIAMTDEMRESVERLKAAMQVFHRQAGEVGFSSTHVSMGGKYPQYDSFALFNDAGDAYEVDGDALKLIERGVM